jgi:hypothetical protein
MIRPSQIEFVPDSIAQRARRASPAAWLGLAGSMVVLAVITTDLLDLGQQLLALQIQVSTLRNQTTARQSVPARASAGTPTNANDSGGSGGSGGVLSAAALKKANQSIDQLNVPWHALFQAIESAAANKVAVLTFEPDPRKNILRLTVEGRTIGIVLAFADRLEEQPDVQNIRLLHHETNAQDKNRPVRLQLELQWLGITP